MRWSSQAADGDCNITAPDAPVATLVIAAREELTVLAEVKRFVAL